MRSARADLSRRSLPDLRCLRNGLFFAFENPKYVGFLMELRSETPISQMLLFDNKKVGALPRGEDCREYSSGPRVLMTC